MTCRHFGVANNDKEGQNNVGNDIINNNFSNKNMKSIMDNVSNYLTNVNTEVGDLCNMMEQSDPRKSSSYAKLMNGNEIDRVNSKQELFLALRNAAANGNEEESNSSEEEESSQKEEEAVMRKKIPVMRKKRAVMRKTVVAKRKHTWRRRRDY